AGVGGNMPADSLDRLAVFFLLVGLDDHGHGVPAHDAFNAALNLTVAGIFRLLVGRDGVYVRCIGSEWDSDPGDAGGFDDFFEEASCWFGTLLCYDLLQGLDPLPCLEIIYRIVSILLLHVINRFCGHIRCGQTPGVLAGAANRRPTSIGFKSVWHFYFKRI